MVKVILELEPTEYEVFSRLVNAEYTRIQNHDSYPCEIPEQEHDIYLDVVSSLNDLTAFPFDSEAKGKAL